jgi:DNA-binding MarR family transcriptional regulator
VDLMEAGEGSGTGPGDADVAAAERSLERLFRLTVNRKLHTRQAAAVGAVVTRAGYAVLRSLHEAGAMTLGELARECSMDPAAAGRQVKALEDEGLVARDGSGDDARVVMVQLTERGADVYRRIVAVRVQHTADVLAEWSQDDRATLVRLVDRLVDDLRAVPLRTPRVTSTDAESTEKRGARR